MSKRPSVMLKERLDALQEVNPVVRTLLEDLMDHIKKIEIDLHYCRKNLRKLP